jgi:peptidoglycan biosynthesis protein MviN/MurJ (putative lipid II flippase)
VLIHRFQAVGTAMSTLITQTVVTSFLAVLLFRELQIHWQLPVWKLVLFVLLAVAIPIMVVHLTSLGWEFQMGISLVATTVVGVGLQFLPIQSFLTLLVKKGD